MAKHKLFIWSTEYDIFLALAKTEEEAKEKLLDHTTVFNLNHKFPPNTITEEEIQEVLENKPVVICEGDSIIYSHANE